MKPVDEIKFFQNAIKILEKGYARVRKPHKGGVDIDCAECRTSIAVSILDRHIDLLQWLSKKQDRLIKVKDKGRQIIGKKSNKIKKI